MSSIRSGNLVVVVHVRNLVLQSKRVPSTPLARYTPIQYQFFDRFILHRSRTRERSSESALAFKWLQRRRRTAEAWSGTGGGTCRRSRVKTRTCGAKFNATERKRETRKRERDDCPTTNCWWRTQGGRQRSRRNLYDVLRGVHNDPRLLYPVQYVAGRDTNCPVLAFTRG